MLPWLLLPQLSLSPGCCGLFVGTTLTQAKQWAGAELPIGASLAQVKEFAARHQFKYSDAPPSNTGPILGDVKMVSLTRVIDTCDSLYSTFIEIYVNLKNDRVTFVVVRQFQFWI